ncbi:uncharacterized protein BJ212DRAFT_1277596, partial [Suillus subaureus]
HCNHTRATPDWNVIYPTHKYTYKSNSHAVTLIHKCINTNNWHQLYFTLADVVVIEHNSAFRKINIFNIYDDCKICKVISLLTTYLDN